MDHILVGNTYPLTLIRRELQISPELLSTLRSEAKDKTIVSYWGHHNSLRIASEFTGFDLTPQTERPILSLSKNGLPTLFGIIFHECWVVSPDYRDGFRPSIGQEVESTAILGWQVLRLKWS